MRLAKRFESHLVKGKAFNRVISRRYGNEAAEIANAVKQGSFSEVSSDQIERCPVCKKIYYEGMEGRSVNELPPTCALATDWEKLWMKDHDSLNVFSQFSLDSSGDTDDYSIQTAANESTVIPHTEEGKLKMKCGPHCCQDSK